MQYIKLARQIATILGAAAAAILTFTDKWDDIFGKSEAPKEEEKSKEYAEFEELKEQ